MSAFDDIFTIVVGEEGGYTANAADPGNWTGGACGRGQCLGTKWGISAGAYPTLDIAGLTLDAAKAIYRRDYWNHIGGDQLPPPLALLVFDAAVNNGPGDAARWLQAAAGVTEDGVIGPETLAAVKAKTAEPAGLVTACGAFQTRRLLFMVALPTWRVFGDGWARRLCTLPFHALGMAGA